MDLRDGKERGGLIYHLFVIEDASFYTGGCSGL